MSGGRTPDLAPDRASGRAPDPARLPEVGGPAFRFFDNREKYLLFVTTCSEKSAIARRLAEELDQIEPKPPALRVFDAGMGDATVLAQVMRGMHYRFPTVPFLVAAKEISLEDVRLSLARMPDRFFEHPQTVVAISNLYYTEAPSLCPGPKRFDDLNWIEVPLEGRTAHEYERQIEALHPVLADGWKVRISPTTGNPHPEKPSVIVLYPKDQRYILDAVIPRRPATPAGAPIRYDLILAAQAYRSRLSAERKVDYVLAPLARSLAPGGRLVGVQSTGKDPGMEIIRRLWPDDDPFPTPRHEILSVLQERLSGETIALNFDPLPNDRSLFHFHLHVMPSDLGGSIGTSTLFAAWNAAVYVAQIADSQVDAVLGDRRYLEITHDVLRRHGGLWFTDESYVVSCRPA